MADLSKPEGVSPAVARLSKGLKLSAGSLLVTMYGDVIAPRPQAPWLGSLIALSAPFGLSNRLVRTAIFRLTADDWLEATRLGRKSFYGLSDAGLLRVQHAGKRIYAGTSPAWDGKWTLVLLRNDTKASMRQPLRRELLWEGFGPVAPGVFAHPNADQDSLAEILLAAGATEHAAVMRAESVASFSRQPLEQLIHQTYRLKEVAQAWQAYVRRFASWVREAPSLSAADAFFVRILLIHEYRRVLLRDPGLPDELLPTDWPGREARAGTGALYAALLPASEAHLRAHMETGAGAFRSPMRVLRERFTSRFHE
ncbi:Phenylacetic acid degradation operon negative regulatory protein PaaX [Cupriavidus sp. U2]|uniref:phenylacetic acid degradation operon negative regulatory protein PaaX n=1 Tax=Cupriavidus sp. U2 TaxID=2920269 RepID=UPI00129E70E8|nr:phenylacetic acid degradation operon negative regulatory protein PaaX [Cupriavidus sp. U2]KAI3593122.1 Phenylacetic acid degradation operon negative regulatory protein PaaX [Cupriavidus sp. U2]